MHFYAITFCTHLKIPFLILLRLDICSCLLFVASVSLTSNALWLGDKFIGVSHLNRTKIGHAHTHTITIIVIVKCNLHLTRKLGIFVVVVDFHPNFMQTLSTQPNQSQTLCHPFNFVAHYVVMPIARSARKTSSVISFGSLYFSFAASFDLFSVCLMCHHGHRARSTCSSFSFVFVSARNSIHSFCLH